MQWEEIVARGETVGASRSLVLAEEVQKAVLTVLSLSGCFDHVVFQGGTALRLFYGNPRFSEDIDLVMVEGVEAFDLGPHMPKIGRYVEGSFPFIGTVSIVGQKEDTELKRWVLRTVSADSEQVVRVHIELATVPSHRNGPRILDFPPVHPAIRVEDASEIMADKVCALAFRPYLKGRDLWDIHFLSRERNIDAAWDLVQTKAGDYGETTSSLAEGLERSVERIRDEGMSTLESELVRFLPPRVMEAYRPSLGSILEAVLDVIGEGPDV
jgi:predicted nucleotidyltransferase component of viral defense system